MLAPFCDDFGLLGVEIVLGHGLEAEGRALEDPGRASERDESCGQRASRWACASACLPAHRQVALLCTELEQGNAHRLEAKGKDREEGLLRDATPREARVQRDAHLSQ